MRISIEIESDTIGELIFALQDIICESINCAEENKLTEAGAFNQGTLLMNETPVKWGMVVLLKGQAFDIIKNKTIK